MKSVSGYLDLTGDPSNLQFLSYANHFKAHGGNWRNVTNNNVNGFNNAAGILADKNHFPVIVLAEAMEAFCVHKKVL